MLEIISAIKRAFIVTGRLIQRPGIRIRQTVAIIGMLLLSQHLLGGTVIGSRHDRSPTDKSRVCEFCHTPYNANTNIAGPLWSHAEASQTFTLYASPGMTGAAVQPHSASRLCLSCHDGVNASAMISGDLVRTRYDRLKPPDTVLRDTTLLLSCERCDTDMHGDLRTGGAGVGLRNNHPISVAYPTLEQSIGYRIPSDAEKGWGGTSPYDVKLYGGLIECGSCHQVHNPDIAPFLRKSNASSGLCLTCHAK